MIVSRKMAGLALTFCLLPAAAQAEYPTAQLLLDTSQTVAGEPVVYPAGAARINSAIVRIPPKTATGWHHHGIPNFAYVLSGQVEVEYADHTRRVYKQGDAFMEAMHMKHIGANTSDEPTEILVVNMGVEGQPHVFADAPPEVPPVVVGAQRKPDLVALAEVDPRLRLDIRYATAGNFTGKPAYKMAGAYLQRPAALALKAANDELHAAGYGLVIFDAYRPWQVTRDFWDNFPQHRAFLADPLQGSRHNRGCAVDLGLFDVRSGKPISMTSDYDEFTQRASPDYAGGTAAQRAARDLLRTTMEAHGFSVYPNEWWHFDYRDWAEYPLLNLSFETLLNATSSSK
jgi:D-alanyl-D-alanine dipeptidase